MFVCLSLKNNERGKYLIKKSFLGELETSQLTPTLLSQVTPKITTLGKFCFLLKMSGGTAGIIGGKVS